MKKVAIIGFLIACCFSAFLFKDNRIIINSRQPNSIQLVGGVWDGLTATIEKNYQYTFLKVPTWLSVTGNRLLGQPSSDDNGPWQVEVNYKKGDTSGSFLLDLVLTGKEAPETDRFFNYTHGFLVPSGVQSLAYTYEDGIQYEPTDSRQWIVFLPLQNKQREPKLTPSMASSIGVVAKAGNNLQVSLESGDLLEQCKPYRQKVKAAAVKTNSAKVQLDKANESIKKVVDEIESKSGTVQSKEEGITPTKYFETLIANRSLQSDLRSLVQAEQKFNNTLLLVQSSKAHLESARNLKQKIMQNNKGKSKNANMEKQENMAARDVLIAENWLELSEMNFVTSRIRLQAAQQIYEVLFSFSKKLMSYELSAEKQKLGDTSSYDKKSKIYNKLDELSKYESKKRNAQMVYSRSQEEEKIWGRLLTACNSPRSFDKDTMYLDMTCDVNKQENVVGGGVVQIMDPEIVQIGGVRLHIGKCTRIVCNDVLKKDDKASWSAKLVSGRVWAEEIRCD